jgi:hypothetical protein
MSLTIYAAILFSRGLIIDQVNQIERTALLKSSFPNQERYLPDADVLRLMRIFVHPKMPFACAQGNCFNFVIISITILQQHFKRNFHSTPFASAQGGTFGAVHKV